MSLPAKMFLSSSFPRGPSCPRKETRRRQLSRRWSRLVSLSFFSVPSSFSSSPPFASPFVPSTCRSPSLVHLVFPSRSAEPIPEARLINTVEESKQGGNDVQGGGWGVSRGGREGRAYKLLHRIVVSLRPVTTRSRHLAGMVYARESVLLYLVVSLPSRPSPFPPTPCHCATPRR